MCEHLSNKVANFKMVTVDHPGREICIPSMNNLPSKDQKVKGLYMQTHIQTELH